MNYIAGLLKNTDYKKDISGNNFVDLNNMDEVDKSKDLEDKKDCNLVDMGDSMDSKEDSMALWLLESVEW